jgi:hypothetical protein
MHRTLTWMVPGQLALAACAIATVPLAAQVPTAQASATSGALAGAVWDSTARAPLAGAVVLLAPAGGGDGTTLNVLADTLGRWAAGGLEPGVWKVTFLHRRAEEYGMVPVPREARVGAGDTTRVELALPSAATLRTALCGTLASSTEKGVIVGSVRDEDAGAWVAGARVLVGWRILDVTPRPRLRTVRVPATTVEDGTFRLCGVPADDGMLVEAGASVNGDSVVSGEITVLAGEDGVTRVQIGLGRLVTVRDSSAPGGATRLVGTARLEGVVLDPSGQPRAGAHVLVLGTGREVVTSDAGTFRVDSLPSGSWTVDAFSLGLAPTRTFVNLAPGATAHATLQFEATVATLERVRIFGKPSAAQRLMDDFFKRREMGFGRYFTPDDLDKWRPTMLSSLFYQVPGARVFPTPTGMGAIRGRGGCVPEVYLDGMLIMDGADALDVIAPVHDVLAVEAHNEPAGLPGNVVPRTMCMTVLVWTKRDLNKYHTPPRKRRG